MFQSQSGLQHVTASTRASTNNENSPRIDVWLKTSRIGQLMVNSAVEQALANFTETELSEIAVNFDRIWVKFSPNCIGQNK